MFDPRVYPYVPFASYADGLAPAVVADFYNQTQDWMALLYGGMLGRAASICCEEFCRESGAVVTAGGQFGQEMVVQTSTAAQALSVQALAAGDHGVWKGQATGNNYDFIARDADSYIGTRRFIFIARVQLDGLAGRDTKAHLDTAANEGVMVGLGPLSAGAPNLPTFHGGSDKANWQCGLGGSSFDTGVALSSATWYWLIIARLASNDVHFWVTTSLVGAIGAPVRTINSGAAWSGARRYLRVKGTAAAVAGEGIFIDKFARGIER
jgi:hypothetical protein